MAIAPRPTRSLQSDAEARCAHRLSFQESRRAFVAGDVGGNSKHMMGDDPERLSAFKPQPESRTLQFAVTAGCSASQQESNGNAKATWTRGTVRLEGSR